MKLKKNGIIFCCDIDKISYFAENSREQYKIYFDLVTSVQTNDQRTALPLITSSVGSWLWPYLSGRCLCNDPFAASRQDVLACPRARARTIVRTRVRPPSPPSHSQPTPLLSSPSRCGKPLLFDRLSRFACVVRASQLRLRSSAFIVVVDRSPVVRLSCASFASGGRRRGRAVSAPPLPPYRAHVVVFACAS